MNIPRKYFKKYFNQKGMTLVEVMIIATVMSIMSLGMATLFKNITNTQIKTSSKSAIYELKNQIEAAIRNDEAWANTVNAAANGALACLRDGGTCPTGGPINGNIQIRSASNTIIFNGTAANGGFDYNAITCATWAAAGSDTCPFRYTFTWQFTCPADANPCPNPVVTVQGVLLFSPGDASEGSARFNLNEFGFTVNRKVSRRFEPFEIRYIDTNGADDGSYGSGGGACRNNAWVPRRLNQILDFNNSTAYDIVTAAAGWDVLPAHPQIGGAIDPASVNIGEFRLRRGTYECTIMAQGYSAVDGFQIRLRDITNGRFYNAGGVMGALDVVSYSTGTVNFSIRNDAWFRVEHLCREDVTPPTDNNVEGHPDNFGAPGPYAPPLVGPAPTINECNFSYSSGSSARLYGCHNMTSVDFAAGTWEVTRGDDYTMGIPLNIYSNGGTGGTVYTSISCVRSS